MCVKRFRAFADEATCPTTQMRVLPREWSFEQGAGFLVQDHQLSRTNAWRRTRIDGARAPGGGWMWISVARDMRETRGDGDRGDRRREEVETLKEGFKPRQRAIERFRAGTKPAMPSAPSRASMSSLTPRSGISLWW